MNKREAGMMCIAGFQGVGKTYQNMHVISNYIQDKPNGVKGRKVLIFDTNGEYTHEQFVKNNVYNVNPKRIALKDIKDWSISKIVECRKIDAKNLNIKDKKKCLEYILHYFKNGMLVIEDINTYILKVTHMEEIVGKIVNLRHRAVDVLISYQSLRPIEPRIFQNSRWIRLHYQTDNVLDVKGKLPNIALFKVAQNLVNERYFNGDQRFFVYIYNAQNKIRGKFTISELKDAIKKFILSNKKYLKEYKQMNDCTDEDALDGLTNQYLKEFYE
ncbi:MAG: DUF87 domain-containing protein [Candidatus Woesearchaeota archaeon]